MQDTKLGQVVSDVEGVRTAYDHEHEQPVAGYTAILAGAATAGIAVAAARLTGIRLPTRIPVLDIVLGGIAVHKLARILAKDAVTSPLRAPFTRFTGPEGSGEVSEEVRGSGVRHAVGEMASCPFCLAPWVGGAYVGGLVVAPRATRLVGALMTVVGISDFLQQLYGKVKE